MRQAPSGNALPRWLVLAGSAAIVLHLAAVVVPILDSPSGPWPTPTGRAIDDPPAFAHAVASLAEWHAAYLRISNNDHFIFNRPGDAPAARMEVRLKDAAGNVIQKIDVPDPQANPWVRHREELLVRALAPDLPVPSPGQEMLPPPGKPEATTTVWLGPEDRVPGMAVPTEASHPVFGASAAGFLASPPGCGPLLAASALVPHDGPDPKIQLWLAAVPQHLVPRNKEVMRPSDWAILLARSCARRALGETAEAATAEVVRITREPVTPSVLFGGESPPEAFSELTASFGEVSR